MYRIFILTNTPNMIEQIDLMALDNIPTGSGKLP
jgi:hypothetical protein